MSSQGQNDSSPAAEEKKWRPLNSSQRRVLGVLIEKAKTTPDAYPMTLNGLTTGCNQKNNRQPQTNLSTEQVEQTIEELRQLGAVVEVQAGGRVPKFRHTVYDWLGVDKVEAAIMAELLLRGEQTIGELRGRAARMEPIADLNALRPLLDSLTQKGLVISLTPEGRGQIITHGLYREKELAELRQQYANYTPPPAGGGSRGSSEESAVPRPHITTDMFNELQVEVAELRAEIARLREEVRGLGIQREE